MAGTVHTAQAAPELSRVEHEADRFAAGGMLLLRFDPVLEAAFTQETAASRRRQLLRGGLGALIVFDLFLVSDALMAPQHLLRAAIVRLGIVTPLVLLTAFLVSRRREQVYVQEAAASLLCVVANGALLFLHSGMGAATALQAEPGVLLMLLAVNTVLRPDFWIAIASTLLCYGMFLWFLLAYPQVGWVQLWIVGGRVFWFAVLALAAKYTLSRERRLSWLLHLRGRLQSAMLADSNRHLLNLSFTDPLTGVPNRAAYEKRLAELWQRAIEGRETLAAVMVDVDHFKSINDSFGHLYGDRVLQRVATLLEQSLRAEADFVARFGGEEFIVLLPGSTLASAYNVAERIRVLVEVAGSPAISRTDAALPSNTRWSTVSCGVAAMEPGPGDEARILIDRADAALYTAKRTGRNRVSIDTGLRLAQTA